MEKSKIISVKKEENTSETDIVEADQAAIIEESEKVVLEKEEDIFTQEKLEKAIERFNDRYQYSEEYKRYIQVKPLVPDGLVPAPTHSRKSKKG